MTINQSLEGYFEDWHPYDKLIKHNYMRHREIIEVLKQRLPSGASRELSILELGCGNAWTAKMAFGDLENVRYCGIDLSSFALKVAEGNLQSDTWVVELIEGDIAKVLVGLDEQYDLVMAGFSLHHFSSSSTLRILEQARKHLSPVGEVIVYDIVTRESEEVFHFLERLIQGINDRQMELDQTQIESISHHIRNYDFPMDLPSWGKMAQRAGFSASRCIYRDEDERCDAQDFFQGLIVDFGIVLKTKTSTLCPNE